MKELNQSSNENAQHLTQVQQTVQSSVDQMTKFLFEQVDFEALHQQAMLKVHKEELQQKQNQTIAT